MAILDRGCARRLAIVRPGRRNSLFQPNQETLRWSSRYRRQGFAGVNPCQTARRQRISAPNHTEFTFATHYPLPRPASCVCQAECGRARRHHHAGIGRANSPRATARGSIPPPLSRWLIRNRYRLEKLCWRANAIGPTSGRPARNGRLSGSRRCGSSKHPRAALALERETF